MPILARQLALRVVPQVVAQLVMVLVKMPAQVNVLTLVLQHARQVVLAAPALVDRPAQ